MTLVLGAARFVALSSAAALISQALNRLTAYLAGLIGTTTVVADCAEPQANAGLCGPNSQIGETTTNVGKGNDPFTATGGKVYLTGPYNGAPFGLSVPVPAHADPFNLANIIPRAKIYIDFYTKQVRLASKRIPHIIDGIPLEIKHVNVTIDRPGFTFNPTNCN